MEQFRIQFAQDVLDEYEQDIWTPWFECIEDAECWADSIVRDSSVYYDYDIWPIKCFKCHFALYEREHCSRCSKCRNYNPKAKDDLHYDYLKLLRELKHPEGRYMIEVIDDDTSQGMVELAEALLGSDRIRAEAELSPDTTEEEMELYGYEALYDAAKSLYKKHLSDHLAWEQLARISHYDEEGPDGDYTDVYVIWYNKTIKEAV